MSWLGPIAFVSDFRGVFHTWETVRAGFGCFFRGRHKWKRVGDQFKCKCGIAIILVGLDGEWDAVMSSPGRWKAPLIHWRRLH